MNSLLGVLPQLHNVDMDYRSVSYEPELDPRKKIDPIFPSSDVVELIAGKPDGILKLIHNESRNPSPTDAKLNAKLHLKLSV